ncbi:phage tail protein [Xanthomonas vasicola]|nr:phage tail protein [Xanthomonas vasicola]KNX93445.1 tail protein [Xanthomonas vasicola]MDO6985041.1 phage tail protein [Xanthomonas vasicola]PPV03835.1 phage tail protein [Xanthomonas vasicola]TWQ29200.1 phage tail protein [Xanthomonas vasicola]TWR09939.1 phage tail protein [Xanthomonas vasicola]
MIKPASLRAHLVEALPDLARDADRLLVFIDAGSLVSTYQPGLSFEYQYTLNLILTDYAGHPNSVMLPLLEWVQANQSELLSNTARRGDITFEADILANDAVDLSIKLPLTERVVVTAKAGGGYDMTHAPEPVIDPTWMS